MRNFEGLLASEESGFSIVTVKGGSIKGSQIFIDRALEPHYELGTYELPLQSLLSKIVRPGNIAFDVGAHVGFLSILIGRLVGDSGAVYAFEPDPENVWRLRENIRTNQMNETVFVVPKCVSSKSENIIFRRSSRDRTQGGIISEGNVTSFSDAERRTVAAISLDDFVASTGVSPSVIKIDVEGAEGKVLQGASQLLRRSRPWILCEVHSESSRQEVQSWVVPIGYLVENIVPPEKGVGQWLLNPDGSPILS